MSAKHADRIAWLAYDHGQRNVYAAAAPDFKPVRLTSFLNDDGVVLTDLSISDDGSTVAFVRGSEPNREGWIANPSSDVAGGGSNDLGGAHERRRGVETRGGQCTGAVARRSLRRVREGWSDLSRARGARRAGNADRQDRAAHEGVGTKQQSALVAGRLQARVRQRPRQSLVRRRVRREDEAHRLHRPERGLRLSPTWSPDWKQIAFIRRPGTPFGQQAQAGDGSIGNPGGPGAAGRGGRGGRGGGGGRGGAATDVAPDGLYRAVFRGGYTISFMVANVAAPDSAREFWHNQPSDRTFANINGITWAGESVIFQQEPEEWIRIYAVHVSGGASTPIELTPGAGAVETLGLSNDGKTLFYATNAGDIDRRHVWKVPTAGGSATQITTGDEIEMYPAPLSSGKDVAVLTSAATRPMSVGIVPIAGGAKKLIFPVLSKADLAVAQVAPTSVVLKADDGVEFHNQLFLPKDLKPNERRPAIVFVHGGPVRQMLLGYHYMDFYHTAYAVNEWLASRGYIVMSVNYRSGIGYGKSFRTAANVGGRGNAEYRDVIAAGKYLQTRARRRSDARRNLGIVVRRRAHGAGAGAQLRRLCGRRRHGGRASLGQLARLERRLVQIVVDLGDRRLEVAGAHLAQRRRSQRRVLADDRTRRPAARAQRLLRAHRQSGRHARDAVAQAMAVPVRTYGHVSRAVLEEQKCLEQVIRG